MALNTRFLDEFGVKYLTGSDNDTCAYNTLCPWCGRTLPQSGVNIKPMNSEYEYEEENCCQTKIPMLPLLWPMM